MLCIVNIQNRGTGSDRASEKTEAASFTCVWPRIPPKL